MTIANLGRQHQRPLDSYSKGSWESLYLFRIIRYYFIPSIWLELVVYMNLSSLYMNFTLIILIFLYSSIIRQFSSKWHFNEKRTPQKIRFFEFPQCVIQKRESSSVTYDFWPSYSHANFYISHFVLINPKPFANLTNRMYQGLTSLKGHYSI